MDITIKVSEKTEQIIREKAGENGKSVEDFAGILLEEILEEKFAETPANKVSADESIEDKKERKHNLLEFAGMFSSGKTDTSERMHEILYSEDFNPAEGFSVK